MSSCKARQHSDQMVCHECGLVWDVNDPDPPRCGRHPESLKDAIKATQRGIAWVPIELPTLVATRMAEAFAAQKAKGLDDAPAMQKAYRVLVEALPTGSG